MTFNKFLLPLLVLGAYLGIEAKSVVTCRIPETRGAYRKAAENCSPAEQKKACGQNTPEGCKEFGDDIEALKTYEMTPVIGGQVHCKIKTSPAPIVLPVPDCSEATQVATCKQLLGEPDKCEIVEG